MGHGSLIAARLAAAVDEGASLFDGVSEERTTWRPSENAWCAREVIGHLIDSACNNHRRFIINQDVERLVAEPYEQQKWIALSGHGDVPAAELVQTWQAYNRQIARVVERIPDEVLNRSRGPLSEYRFPYLAYEPSAAATLRDLIEDYIGHCHHHFTQIRTLLRAG